MIKILCICRERFEKLKIAVDNLWPGYNERKASIKTNAVKYKTPAKVTTTELKNSFEAINNIPLVLNDQYWQWRKLNDWEKMLKKYEE